MQQPVGKDMAAIKITRQLDFIDGNEINIDIAWHGLDRAHPVARAFRLDFLLARNKRNLVGANASHDLVVDFAGQQPQRQADHPRLMAQHALDGQMRLAGICRAQNRRHVTDAVSQVTAHARGLPDIEPLALHCDRRRSSHILDKHGCQCGISITTTGTYRDVLCGGAKIYSLIRAT